MINKANQIKGTVFGLLQSVTNNSGSVQLHTADDQWLPTQSSSTTETQERMYVTWERES